MPKAQPLEYNSTLPPFLQRLKANNLALDGRHNVQIPRARAGVGSVNDRLNMKGEEGEDEPIVVDENGEVVSREEMERMEKGEDGDANDQGEQGGETTVDGGGEAEENGEKLKNTEKVSSGFGKKRKVAKVIVEDGDANVNAEEDDGPDTTEPIKSLEESTKDLKSVVGKGKEDAKKEDSGKKTKRKKIKLSFDEPE